MPARKPVPNTPADARKLGLRQIRINFAAESAGESERWVHLATLSGPKYKVFPKPGGGYKVCYYDENTGGYDVCFDTPTLPTKIV
jgi:hypothetical protein